MSDLGRASRTKLPTIVLLCVVGGCGRVCANSARNGTYWTAARNYAFQTGMEPLRQGVVEVLGRQSVIVDPDAIQVDRPVVFSSAEPDGWSYRVTVRPALRAAPLGWFDLRRDDAYQLQIDRIIKIVQTTDDSEDWYTVWEVVELVDPAYAAEVDVIAEQRAARAYERWGCDWMVVEPDDDAGDD